ncbi:MAG TPA: Rne/Rng family ribonuclease [Acetobacteraceae bacterium]|nr:Rne/Rng family ribonuclease [Acetobacteraceae bacterium]
MTKRMLIDATHAEETRVVVLDGNRLEDFDVETQSRRQLKGNIYLAKIVRVEPSLQAAFVEYGGNRHGFLAFSEIHPDYYQIPIADRQRLLAMQEEEARAEEEREEQESGATETEPEISAEPLAIEPMLLQGETTDQPEPGSTDVGADAAPEAMEPASSVPPEFDVAAEAEADLDDVVAQAETVASDSNRSEYLGSRVQEVPAANHAPPETVGGEPDHGEEVRERRTPRFMRSYKIQEVIRRRQIILVQVVKEERGTKGAALTTYISLAGRYSVLMPNSPRGGGISRKITSAADRRRLKEVTAELDIPRGMGLIVRTAGANRPKPEIKRDCEYLLRLWDEIRELTLRSVAPSLIYEEASLIKRAIRDVYSRDVDEILVDGEEGWKAARDFMRMLMPTHAKKVQLWRDGGTPLFARQQVEAQLDAMLSPTVQLKSGGYLVINQAEALVAIDVNSGRSTRERGIEETALRTNLEAADEVARQLRLRDLAGLIVIDFIDMESKKNNAAVERRLKEALKNDRARIQVGHISHFGLMEMSRQRLRPSIAETSLTICAHCGGLGHVRSTESAGLHALRAIEEEGSKRRAAEILVHLPGAIAFYVLNHKRLRLTDIETRYGMKVSFAADESLAPSNIRIDRLRALAAPEMPPPPIVVPPPTIEAEDDDPRDEADSDELVEATGGDSDDVPVPGETAEEGERRRRRRRRRRRGAKREDSVAAAIAPMPDGAEQPDVDVPAFPGARSSESIAAAVHTVPDDAPLPDAQAPRPADNEASESARRSRRSRSRRRPETAKPPAPAATYAGPTPADPFGNVVDIFDLLEQSETVNVLSSPSAPSPTNGNGEVAPAALADEASVVADPAPVTSEEPLVGPAIQPVVVGAAGAVVEKKRGWWRK